MPKVARELGPLDVKRLTYHSALDAIAKRQKHRPPDDRPVLVNVGGVSGLHLQITPNDAKSWVLRVVIGDRRRAIGLGSLGDVPLAKAHERAREAKAAIRDGIDPIEQRRAARAALSAKDARAKTFKQAFDDFLPIRLAKIDTERSRQRWQSTVELYVLPKIGTIGVGDITKADILRVLRQKHTNKRNGTDGDLWTVIPETASKLRGRIEEVLAWATSNGYRTGDNPARWAGNLEHDLTAPGTIITATPHPAVSLDDAPAWFAAISKHDGMSARALEFVALTAARSGEVRGMVWSEVDLDGALWTVPATRMKVTANGDHAVPLCDDAVKLLRRLHNQRPADCDYVFPAPRGGPLSDMALSMLMRDMHAAEVKQGRKGWLDSRSGKPAVVHGLRSTFSTWANDHAEYEPDMIEFALAHRVGTDVAKRYRRGSMVEKRRAMMRDWAKFLRGEKSP